MTRHDAREQAFIVLFEKIFNDDMTVAEIVENAVECDFIKINGFAQKILDAVSENDEAIDAFIAQYSREWSIDRLPRVSLSVLRLAVAELKYLDDADYSGIKGEICDLVDLYVNYILENGNQADVLEDIVSQFKNNPKAYVTVLSTLLKDKSKLVLGMKNFVYAKAPEAKSVCDKYGFSMDTLFNMLSKNLEEEKWQWREQEVAETAGKLVLDFYKPEE